MSAVSPAVSYHWSKLTRWQLYTLVIRLEYVRRFRMSSSLHLRHIHKQYHKHGNELWFHLALQEPRLSGTEAAL